MKKKVSLLTPTTKSRFHFFERLIICVENQDYKNFEWIILDDYFNENLYNLVKSKSFVRYISCNKKKNIGEKRNQLNELATGDLLINIDDDDYYPPNKISYTLKEMTKNPEYLVSGSSCIYMYFDKNIYKIGPYGNNHATANTFSYYKSYSSKYATVSKGEEKSFLKNYTTNLLQLESKNVILVIRHNTNTANNANINRYRVAKTTLNLSDFIENDYLRSLFE